MCFFGVVLAVVLYELRRLCLLIKCVWDMWRTRKSKEARRASHTIIEEMEGGASAAGDEIRSRAGSTAGGVMSCPEGRKP